MYTAIYTTNGNAVHGCRDYHSRREAIATARATCKGLTLPGNVGSVCVYEREGIRLREVYRGKVRGAA